MADSVFITSTDVARILELDSAAAFLRQRERLETYHAFPPPAPMQTRPLRWRRDAVTAWLARQGYATTDDDMGPDLAHGIASGKVSLLNAARTP